MTSTVKETKRYFDSLRDRERERHDEERKSLKRRFASAVNDVCGAKESCEDKRVALRALGALDYEYRRSMGKTKRDHQEALDSLKREKKVSLRTIQSLSNHPQIRLGELQSAAERDMHKNRISGFREADSARSRYSDKDASALRPAKSISGRVGKAALGLFVHVFD